MVRDKIEAEIQNLEQQRRDALLTIQQAEGAIGALRWALQQLDEAEPEKLPEPPLDEYPE